jgi:hypothetical protein
LPIFDRFRDPEKLVLLPAVLVPALAARGLDEVRRRRGLSFAVALLALATADLALVNARPGRGLLPTVPAALLHEPPATARLVGRGRYVADLPDAPADGTPEQRFRRDRDQLAGGLGGLYGLESASGYGPFAPRALRDLEFATLRDQYYLYVAAVTGEIVPAGAAALALRHPDREAPQSLAIDPVPGTGLAVARAPGGPRATVVPLRLADRAESPDRFGCFPARVVERDGDHVLLEAEAREPSLVVASELYLDGVEATVDDAPAEVVCSDVALVAVSVPPGTHRVRFTWHVTGLVQGVVASLGGLGLLVWLFFRRGS